MKIRRATTEDIPFMVEGFRETHRDIDCATEEGYITRLKTDILVKNPKAEAYILEKDGTAVGFTVYAHGYFTSSGAILWISQLYIAPQHRGYLLQSAVNMLTEHGKRLGANSLVWCTENQHQHVESLWDRGGAKNLNDKFSFWYIPTQPKES